MTKMCLSSTTPRCFPARLYGNKEKTGARIEVFLLRELNEELRLWDVLVDPARKIRIGNKLYFGDRRLYGGRGDRQHHFAWAYASFPLRRSAR